MPTSKTDFPPLSQEEVSGIIGMAWSDDTPFEAIALQFGLNEAQVIALMRDQLKARSFRVWRMRVRGRSAKHGSKQDAQQALGLQASAPDWAAALDSGQVDFPVRTTYVKRDALN
ncbi:TIGR03643 family protein [Limnohabitans sp. G3-2]|uniref:TIGR03643 family protein n=1 Tax=Limnohabitans sp. G3-2 TaxID=1100711 RepID=UPI000C1EEEA2|nr:TIGR03643 family protein [Limnohabitans sp. G3-2]PIT73228.1 TIGR03643 family protein [Limnohabitans sp. G3-2]